MSILHTFPVSLSLLLSQFPTLSVCVCVCRFPTPLPGFRSSRGPVPAGPAPPAPSSQELPGRGAGPGGPRTVPFSSAAAASAATGAMNGRLSRGWISDVPGEAGRGTPGPGRGPRQPLAESRGPRPAVPPRDRGSCPLWPREARAAQRVLLTGAGVALCTARACSPATEPAGRRLDERPHAAGTQ